MKFFIKFMLPECNYGLCTLLSALCIPWGYVELNQCISFRAYRHVVKQYSTFKCTVDP